jgi:hypothetical protein
MRMCGFGQCGRDWRIIADRDDSMLLIGFIRIGNRREVCRR